MVYLITSIPNYIFLYFKICLFSQQKVEGEEDEEDLDDEEKEDDQNLAVYDFDEDGGSAEGGESEDEEVSSKPRASKGGIKKVTQTVSQAHMCNYCNYTSPKRYMNNQIIHDRFPSTQNLPQVPVISTHEMSLRGATSQVFCLRSRLQDVGIPSESRQHAHGYQASPL